MDELSFFDVSLPYSIRITKVMQIDLSSRKIFITGAGKGIGLALVRHLVESGAQVWAHYRSFSPELHELSQNFKTLHLVQGDLSNPKDAEQVFIEVCSQAGTLTGVVWNAGIFKGCDITESSESWMKVWHQTMDINLHAVGQLTQLALQHFIAHGGGGQMIFVASRAAFRGETADYLAYAASKGALVSLGKSVARSFGKQGVTSFVLAPGFTRTQMAESFIQEAGEEKVLSEIGLTTLTTPEDIAPLVTLILSGLMNHASGTTLDFNAASYMH